jgi:hypothetical protein
MLGQNRGLGKIVCTAGGGVPSFAVGRAQRLTVVAVVKPAFAALHSPTGSTLAWPVS